MSPTPTHPGDHRAWALLRRLGDDAALGEPLHSPIPVTRDPFSAGSLARQPAHTTSPYTPAQVAWRPAPIDLAGTVSVAGCRHLSWSEHLGLAVAYIPDALAWRHGPLLHREGGPGPPGPAGRHDRHRQAEGQRRRDVPVGRRQSRRRERHHPKTPPRQDSAGRPGLTGRGGCCDRRGRCWGVAGGDRPPRRGRIGHPASALPQPRATAGSTAPRSRAGIVRAGEDLLTAPSAGAGLVAWLRELVAHAATARGLGPALTGYKSDPEFSPHTMIREAAQQLLARAHREGSVDPSVTVDDVTQLANGISLATESLPDPAQRVPRSWPGRR